MPEQRAERLECVYTKSSFLTPAFLLFVQAFLALFSLLADSPNLLYFHLVFLPSLTLTQLNPQLISYYIAVLPTPEDVVRWALTPTLCPLS